MTLKLAENSVLHSMIVGLCDTQISRFSPILTNNTHREIKKKLVKKSADFFGQEKSADFFVGGEIVWWDTSFTLFFFFFHLHNLHNSKKLSIGYLMVFIA